MVRLRSHNSQVERLTMENLDFGLGPGRNFDQMVKKSWSFCHLLNYATPHLMTSRLNLVTSRDTVYFSKEGWCDLATRQVLLTDNSGTVYSISNS